MANYYLPLLRNYIRLPIASPEEVLNKVVLTEGIVESRSICWAIKLTLGYNPFCYSLIKINPFDLETLKAEFKEDGREPKIVNAVSARTGKAFAQGIAFPSYKSVIVSSSDVPKGFIDVQEFD